MMTYKSEITKLRLFFTGTGQATKNLSQGSFFQSILEIKKNWGWHKKLAWVGMRI